MSDYERVVLSVDTVCFAVEQRRLQVLLVQRGNAPDEPFPGSKGYWALPGGRVRSDQTLREAAAQTLARRAGVTPPFLVQLYTFGDRQRDPRGWAVAVTYYTLLPSPAPPHPGNSVTAAAWHPVDGLARLPLAFDHGRIVRYARSRLAAKLEYAPVALQALPPEFTMVELREIYEAVTDEAVDLSNLAKLVVLTRRWAQPTDRVRRQGPGRPARVYRATSAAGLVDVEGEPQ